MEKSINFYTLLLQIKPCQINDERWVTFDCGNCLSLYNRQYDEALLKSDRMYFNEAYLKDFNRSTSMPMNNLVVLT